MKFSGKKATLASAPPELAHDLSLADCALILQAKEVCEKTGLHWFWRPDGLAKTIDWPRGMENYTAGPALWDVEEPPPAEWARWAREVFMAEPNARALVALPKRLRYAPIWNQIAGWRAYGLGCGRESIPILLATPHFLSVEGGFRHGWEFRWLVPAE